MLTSKDRPVGFNRWTGWTHHVASFWIIIYHDISWMKHNESTETDSNRTCLDHRPFQRIPFDRMWKHTTPTPLGTVTNIASPMPQTSPKEVYYDLRWLVPGMECHWYTFIYIYISIQILQPWSTEFFLARFISQRVALRSRPKAQSRRKQCLASNLGGPSFLADH